MGTDDILLDEADISRILTRMSYEILEDHQDLKSLALVGIQTRGVYLARRIRNKIKEIEGVEVDTGELDIALYRDDWTSISQQPIVKPTEISFAIREKHIILVDDVLFTGRTIRAAMDALIDFGRPRRIELAVLADRGHRELPIQADYVGKIIDTAIEERVDVLMKEHDGQDLVKLREE